MTLSRPSAIVTLGTRTLTAPEAGLASLSVHLKRGAHDRVELTFWPKSKFASAATGDEASVKLGPKDSEVDVWSGTLTSVERTPTLLVVIGHAPTAALTSERKANTYLAQTLGDIVRDLAGSVTIDALDADADVPYYAVDQRRAVWGHLLDLASLSGHEVTCSPTGGLRFQPVSALPSTTRFRFGAELLGWGADPQTRLTPPTFAAHGSASESGSDKWHWLNPDPTSGSGGAQVIGGFHARAQAEALTTAVAERATRAALTGDVELVGQPTLRVGDVFTLSDLPTGDVGPVRAVGVVHTLDGRRGFRTLAHFEGVA